MLFAPIHVQEMPLFQTYSCTMTEKKRIRKHCFKEWVELFSKIPPLCCIAIIVQGWIKNVLSAMFFSKGITYDEFMCTSWMLLTWFRVPVTFFIRKFVICRLYRICVKENSTGIKLLYITEAIRSPGFRGMDVMRGSQIQEFLYSWTTWRYLTISTCITIIYWTFCNHT